MTLKFRPSSSAGTVRYHFRDILSETAMEARDQAAADRQNDWKAELKLTLLLMAGIAGVAYLVFLAKGLLM
jgi:hypothetical protein